MKEREGYLWTAVAGAVLMPAVPIIALAVATCIKSGFTNFRLEYITIPLVAIVFLSPVQVGGAILAFQVPRIFRSKPHIPHYCHVILGSVMMGIVLFLYMRLFFYMSSPVNGNDTIDVKELVSTATVSLMSACWVVWQGRRELYSELPFWPQYSLAGLVLGVLFVGVVMAVLFTV